MNELFNKYASWQILQYFALNPTKEVYVKEIAKNLSLSPSICSKTLRELLKSGILEKRSSGQGQAHYYKLSNNYLTKELKRFIGLFMIHEAGLVNKIAEASEGLTSIALYGSYATGEFNENSDIDLLVISSKKQKLRMRTLEQTIGKNINIQLFSIGQWLKMKKENDSFYLTVVKSHILLYGSELP
jgi:predicted nucleotidyltransferase